MNYKEALEYIAQASWRGSKPGLERITRLCALMGNPQRELKFIHVAGTNGKGSVCALLSNILYKAGYKTGLFTSPYLEVFNERMRINGKNIPDGELAQITEYVKPFADSMADDLPTEFELNTAIAFEYFKRNRCDIVVLETGMGGELDSTNVIEAPEIAVITNIALDHTEYLGKTTEEIARTKSKIIKPGCSVVLYKQGKKAEDAIRERCAQTGAKLYVSEPESLELMEADINRSVFRTEKFGVFALPLIGGYQADNAACALKCVEVLREKGYKITTSALTDGIESARWPGRFEILMKNPVFIVDGAHNPDAARRVSSSLERIFPDEKFIFIFGVMADKNYMEMLDIILPLAKEVICAQPKNERALDADALSAIINKKGIPACACQDAKEAAGLALEKSRGRTCVCALGSLYMAGDIRSFVLEKMRMENHIYREV